MRYLATTLAIVSLGLITQAKADDPPKPIKCLIITGDNIGIHDWKGTTQVISDALASNPNIKVDVTSAPADDLTDQNLAKYEVLLLNYRNTNEGSPKSKWSEANMAAFLKAIQDGKGLVVVHWASAAFVDPPSPEFEKAIAGGWRKQGFHGPAHEFTVKTTDVKHPISEGLPSEFKHVKDELYQNSLLTPGSTVLATAYSDPKLPKGTGKDEAMVWVNSYGKGRVANTVMGHDASVWKDPNLQTWLKRSVEWAATGQVAKK